LKGGANNWLDRPVNLPKVSSLTLEQWIAEIRPAEESERRNAGGQSAEKRRRRAS
jgi:hypothetical protein